MTNSTVVKLACALVMCIVVAAPLAEAAVTCGLVSSKVAQCIPYLKGGAAPTPGCCTGIKALNSAAATAADKKIACGCLKSAAAAISGIDYSKAAGLPGKCGVSIPYAISPSTNCNAIH
ncbi:non-specific lipid-transfer protein-like [Chenopodium quinoa]|uniref:Non-specific lipid-transfer protein n=1 Tax=Chenopodium quinoa TaxID=63459 RepID=A0A803L3E2_CHEQI|nr:non-specific lipid-transfer protein-like [Chenopodium quinoa]